MDSISVYWTRERICGGDSEGPCDHVLTQTRFVNIGQVFPGGREYLMTRREEGDC